jgi:hypothetical protein
MNRLQRDCFFFAATATLLAACCTPAIVTETGTPIRKTIKADGSGGIVERNENLQLVQPTDSFTAIGGPQAQPIYGAISPPPKDLKRKTSLPPANMYHIKYNNSIVVALGAEPSPTKSSVVPTNNQYLRYRIWIPTDTTDNIGQWSDWTKSNDPNGPDTDKSKSPLSGTPLEAGKWHLAAPSPTPSPDKTITIHATAKDSKGNQTQYSWTGAWSPLTKDGHQDPSGRGSITWTSP